MGLSLRSLHTSDEAPEFPARLDDGNRHSYRCLVRLRERESPEIRYFVVLGTERNGENWEIGIIHARTKWGHDGATARRERMGVLFDELRTAVSMV